MAAPQNPFVGATYASALAWIAERFGQDEALVFGGRRFTFAEAKARIDEASRRFQALGLRPGERVALWIPNRPEFLWCWLGASQIGLIAVVLNTRLKLPEVQYQLAQSESAAIVIPGPGSFRDFPADVAELCPEALAGRDLNSDLLPSLRWIIVLDRGIDWPGAKIWPEIDATSAPAPAYATNPDEPRYCPTVPARRPCPRAR
jgi:fatty-acyl-CoA synthase